MKKRILSLLLALVLCLSLFSLPVLAVGPRVQWLDVEASEVYIYGFSYSAVLDRAFVAYEYKSDSEVAYAYEFGGEVVRDSITIDLSTGSPVEDCEWDPAGDISDTLAKVSQANGERDKKYGLVNKDGQVVVPIEYDSIDSFSENLVKVSQTDGERNEKYGLVNKDGQVVVPVEYSRINSFSDGLARVTKTDARGDYSSGYIDQEGRPVIPLSYYEACDFSEGLARVNSSTVNGYIVDNAFINTNGNEVISLDRYDNYSDRFSDGLAWVCKENEWGERRYGYIDTYGQLVIPLSYREAHDFSEGLALVATDEHRCFINTQGETVFTVDEYPGVGQFSNGLVRVTKDRSNQGFLNTKGEVVVPTKYSDIRAFSNGLALACTQDGEKYFINTDGEIAIPLDDYASAGDFTGGLAQVGRIDQKDDNQTTWDACKYGLIDTQGQVVLPVEYDMVYIAVPNRQSDADAPSAAVLVREGDRYGVLKFDHGQPVDDNGSAGSLLPGNGSAGSLLPVVCIAIAAIVAAVIAFMVVKKKKATPSRVCPNCGKPLASNVKFCPHCGCNLQP